MTWIRERGWRDGDVVFSMNMGTHDVHGKAGDLPSCSCQLRVASQALSTQYRHGSLGLRRQALQTICTAVHYFLEPRQYGRMQDTYIEWK